MSSGFVSGGTTDAPIERSDEWLAAQQELEANRRRKAEQDRQNDGRSLFETLQANKAAKEEAFQEAARLKNQFRALDEDEVEYLDSVLESTRAEEDRVKKETAEGLAGFRKQQDEIEKKARQEADDAELRTEEEENWNASTIRKRKRVKEKEGLKGVKLRKSSTSELTSTEEMKTSEGLKINEDTSARASPADDLKPTIEAALDAPNKTPAPTAVKSKIAPGLVSYGSDSDDD